MMKISAVVEGTSRFCLRNLKVCSVDIINGKDLSNVAMR
jgi:hypothetical protein